MSSPGVGWVEDTNCKAPLIIQMLKGAIEVNKLLLLLLLNYCITSKNYTHVYKLLFKWMNSYVKIAIIIRNQPSAVFLNRCFLQ